MTQQNRCERIWNAICQYLSFFLIPFLAIVSIVPSKKVVPLAKRSGNVRTTKDRVTTKRSRKMISRPGASGSSSSDEDGTLGDEEAKAIADSLVTRAPPIMTSSEKSSSRRRSARILRLQNEDNKRSSVKSPTSAALSPDIAKKAKQRASLIARPLVPVKPSRKTLILDLDETLIHSLSKGGKMSSGHMVEVKLGVHAILYYVHKRPYCDLFLEKVAMWYDVVIFTASVQEYADPVIDWLEQDRKYFKARYYRQHCTYRYGAYMKDLSVVEADLSKAIIVDNSPLSYRLNEENAVPIEGWISDPSDRDLLYLITMLQSLSLVNDVRSLLSLRHVD